MKTRTIIFSLLLLIVPLLLHSQPGRSVKTPPVLKAGIVKIDITPGDSVKMYGYAARKKSSVGVHDPISARVIVFEKGDNRFLLLSSDLGAFGNDVFPVIQEKLMKKFNLRDSEILLSAIHSHSSPVLTLDKQTGDPNNIRYTEELSEKIVSAASEAIRNMQPVKTGTGTGYSPVGSNRREMKADGSVVLGRNPYGVTDKEVLVMKIESADGKPLAAIFDYATHATSLGPKNLLLSGDVLGLSAQFVEKILGNDVVSPVFAGASGNIDPWYRVLPEFNQEPGWIPEPVLLGTMLGEEVVHVFRDIKETGADQELKSCTSIVDCKRKKSDNTAADETIPVKIIAVRIGNAAFIGFNVEMLTELGMKIKAGSPFKNTFVITHCNGSSGYLPPIELYKEGGYEVTSTRFEPGSAELIVKEAIRMLHTL